MKTLFRSLLLLSLYSSLSAQDLGGHGEPDSNDTGTYRIDVSGPPGEAAAVGILSFGFGFFGPSFIFEAEPDKHYMVWQSGGLELWNYETMAGSIGPGLYSAHLPQLSMTEASNCFFLIIEVAQAQQTNPLQMFGDLETLIPYLDELEPAQRAVVDGKANDLAIAIANQGSKQVDLTEKRRQLGDCTGPVEEARLAAEAAAEEARLAHNAADELEAPVLEIDDQLLVVIGERQAAAARAAAADQVAIDALATASSLTEQAQAPHLTQTQKDDLLRQAENLDELAQIKIAERQQATAERMALEDEEAELRAEAEALLPALEAAESEAAAKQTAADQAEADYLAARDACEVKKMEVQQAEEELKTANEEVNQKAAEFQEAAETAAQQARDNIETRAAIEAQEQRIISEQEQARRDAQQAEEDEKLRRTLAEWKKFFDGIREAAGDQAALDAADEINARMGIGIAALDILKAGLKALAQGNSVSQAMLGMAQSGLTVGYGVLVNYAQSVAVNVVANLMVGTVAKWLKEIGGLRVGETRYVDLAGAKYMVSRNADGSYTVYSWAKNYFTSGGTVRQFVLRE